MRYKTLGLILAAGEGSRVRHVLEDDEPIKALIKAGDKRLIERTIDFIDGAISEIAVLSFPSERYSTLDRLVQENGQKILKQVAKHRRLPTLLELPYILMMQYHFSSEKCYLQQFDSILTMPCDLIFNDVDIREMIEFHNMHLNNPYDRQITIMSRIGTDHGRTDLLKISNDRILGIKKYDGRMAEGYEASNQPGIYIFSQGILKRPYKLFLGFKGNAVYRYCTTGNWTDFGDPKTILEKRNSNGNIY